MKEKTAKEGREKKGGSEARLYRLMVALVVFFT